MTKHPEPNAGLSQTLIANLRREAKRLKRTQGILYTEALQRVAKEIGHTSWESVIKSLKATSTGCNFVSTPTALLIHFDTRSEMSLANWIWMVYRKDGTSCISAPLAALKNTLELDSENIENALRSLATKPLSPNRLRPEQRASFLTHYRTDAHEMRVTINQSFVDMCAPK